MCLPGMERPLSSYTPHRRYCHIHSRYCSITVALETTPASWRHCLCVSSQPGAMQSNHRRTGRHDHTDAQPDDQVWSAKLSGPSLYLRLCDALQIHVDLVQIKDLRI